MIQKNLYVLCLLAVAILGCEKLKDQTSADSSLLPPNATNVEYLNDYWGKFELDGETFLFHQKSQQSETRCYIHLSKNKNTSSDKFRCPQCGARVVITELGPVQILDKGN